MTLTLALMSAMGGAAFLFEWHGIFAVLSVNMAIFIGMPVLSLASNFWFGETTPPQIHVYDCSDGDRHRLSWLDRALPQELTKRAASLFLRPRAAEGRLSFAQILAMSVFGA
jgi:hypothetical protein